MARGKSMGLAYGAFGLEFLGGILFLVTAAFFIGAGYSSALGAWNTGIASIWLPFIYPAAILAAISVFLISFMNLVGWGRRVSGMTTKLAWIAAATLIVLTAGTTSMWFAIIGFILTLIGSGVSMGEKA